MNNGWIKLHRKLRDNPIYSNSNAVALWIECMMRACHEPQDFYWKRHRVQLIPGQFIFGDEELGLTFNIGKTTTRYWLNQFVIDSMLDIKRTSKGSIGTIINWDKYQSVDSTVGNKRETKGKRKDTYKNVKKDKNEKNIYIDFVDQFNFIKGSKFKYGDTKAKRQLQARLKEGYSLEEIFGATKSALADEYHKETKGKYITPEFITRSDKLSRYVEQGREESTKTKGWREMLADQGIQQQLD